MRAAVYYAPEPNDPLAALGAAWLGRDAIGNLPVPQISPKLACVTGSPARYGFHATLKPPIRLVHGLESFCAATAALAARLQPFALPALRVETMGNALVLGLATPCPDLQSLCDACVAELDSHRVPPSESELARRRDARLSPAQDAHLQRWGYPYVFDQWRFHITLTDPLPVKILPDRQAMAQCHFAAALTHPRLFQSLAIFVEPSPGAAFALHRRFPLAS